VNRSLQHLIYQYMTENESRRYIDALDDLTLTYNSRPHRSLKGMTPNEADLPENENKVSSIQRQRFAALLEKKHPVRFKVGDVVRVQGNFGDRFARGYNERFSRTLYEILSVNTRMPVPMYMLRDIMDNVDMDGGFYASGEATILEKYYSICNVQYNFLLQSSKRLATPSRSLRSRLCWTEESGEAGKKSL
jgi:hypothetical protein